MVTTNKKTNVILVIAVVLALGAVAFMADTTILAQPRQSATLDQPAMSLPSLPDLGANLTNFADFQNKFTGATAPVQKEVQMVQALPADQPVLPTLSAPLVVELQPAPETGSVSVQVSPTTNREIVRLDGNVDYAFYCDLIGGKDVYTGDQGTSRAFFSLSDNIRSLMSNACSQH